MLPNNIRTCSVEESDFLPVSGRSRLNSCSHSMHSLMKDRVTSLNDFCSVYKNRLVEQIFITKI